MLEGASILASRRIMDARPSTKTSTVGGDEPVLCPDSETGCATHLTDLTADRIVEWRGGISPQAAHGTVREPLGSYGSYRPAVGLNPRLQW